MLKSVACYALHYGKEYLAWSIRSTQDAVDEVLVLYAAAPSFGHGGEVPCPETEEELLQEANRFATKPVRWHPGRWRSELEHRFAALAEARKAGADLVLVVDADELWAPGVAQTTLRSVYDANRAGRWMASFRNFWRSFDWEVRDGFLPVRIVDLRHPLTFDANLRHDEQPEPVLHFGYAQSEQMVRYKWSCHGHQSELRPDWLEKKFLNWTPESTDLHPVARDLWKKAYPVSPHVQGLVGHLLADHPYYRQSLIR